ncbi:hypothetical protein NFHSH190041_17170 [Shewanella sp. NFH-SH190041]|uniref:hypothetical protein n=1 Tax=Shewanella sp. NFH-SH190041 TaxID=2950245 RepID=UPI0021C429C4|nr:hypothetical protein [Shewanella sp. NFH-SH190041]BDM64265.1 hypothetical protein NFHSH190041_17170 [Shewanella sp. NFH-SH190041]
MQTQCWLVEWAQFLTEELDDGIPFGEKMATPTAKLSDQFAESATLEAEIKKNLAGLGYEL